MKSVARICSSVIAKAILFGEALASVNEISGQARGVSKLDARSALTCFLVIVPLFASAQNPTSAPVEIPARVPRLVQFSGILRDAERKPRSGTAGVIFSIYGDATGGAPLWQETQNVRLDSQGRYSILLGAGTADGIPLELFASGESRWLGVQPMFPGDAELPRVLLVSVPYAMRAGDADTLGGWPPSAFLKAPVGVPDVSEAAVPTVTTGRTGPVTTTPLAGSESIGSTKSHSTSTTVSASNSGICYANDYAGADIFAQFNAAIAACGHGEIRIRQGTYNFVTTTARLTNPADSMVCEGAVTLNFTGSGDAIYWFMIPFTTVPAGKIVGCSIVGTVAGSSGIHMGDIVGWTLDRILVAGFIRSGASGIWWDNHNGWTERGSMTPSVATNGNAIGWRMTNSGGPVTESFCYNRVLGVAISVGQNQTGISTESGKFCHGTMITTINGSGTNKTLISLTGAALWEDSFYEITTEDDGGGGVRLAIGPNARLSGMGLFDNFATTAPLNDSILGGFSLYLPHISAWGLWFVDKYSNLEIQAAPGATVGNNLSAPFIQQKGSYWNGVGPGVDSVTLQGVLGTGTNPSSTYMLSHTGSTGPFGLFVNDGVGHGFALSTTSAACSGGPCMRHDSADDFVLDTSGIGQLYLNADNNRPIQTGAGPFILKGHLGQKYPQGDLAGTVVLVLATSVSHVFAIPFSSSPVCTVTPASNPQLPVAWWVTSTSSSVTVHVQRKFRQSISFNYHCIGNPI